MFGELRPLFKEICVTLVSVRKEKNWFIGFCDVLSFGMKCFFDDQRKRVRELEII